MFWLSTTDQLTFPPLLRLKSRVLEDGPKETAQLKCRTLAPNDGSSYTAYPVSVLRTPSLELRRHSRLGTEQAPPSIISLCVNRESAMCCVICTLTFTHASPACREVCARMQRLVVAVRRAPQLLVSMRRFSEERLPTLTLFTKKYVGNLTLSTKLGLLTGKIPVCRVLVPYAMMLKKC